VEGEEVERYGELQTTCCYPLHPEPETQAPPSRAPRGVSSPCWRRVTSGTVAGKHLLNASRRRKMQAFRAGGEFPSGRSHHPSTIANTSGATMLASDSIMNFGVSTPSFPQVIFSFGTAPE
jgi:hypothetical protein